MDRVLLGEEPITDTGVRDNKAWSGGIFFKLLSQLADEDPEIRPR